MGYLISVIVSLVVISISLLEVAYESVSTEESFFKTGLCCIISSFVPILNIFVCFVLVFNALFHKK